MTWRPSFIAVLVVLAAVTAWRLIVPEMEPWRIFAPLGMALGIASLVLSYLRWRRARANDVSASL